MFNPSEKVNQHYVPQFWQKRLAGSNNSLFVLSDGTIEKANTKKLMTGNWLYTTFDHNWIPSNELEDLASVRESRAAQIMKSLDIPNSICSPEDQLYLREFIAFSACRHPDSMKKVKIHAIKTIFSFADIHSTTLLDYQLEMEKVGLTEEEASNAYHYLKSLSENQLLAAAEFVEGLSPNDALLPAQMAISQETINAVNSLLENHRISILDAPTGEFFVLGDTPFPLDLAHGFTIPLSSTLALLWEPASGDKLPPWSRRKATIKEVTDSNKIQVDNSFKVVIGPTKAVLQKYL